MQRGFLYLVAIMDWFTRKVLAWRISNTLEADFCVEALNEAIHRFGAPGVMNTDQGSQAAIAGLGIASLPHGLCAPSIASVELRRVLPDWYAGGATTTILIPHRRGQLPAVRTVVDFLTDRLPAKLDG